MGAISDTLTLPGTPIGFPRCPNAPRTPRTAPRGTRQAPPPCLDPQSSGRRGLPCPKPPGRPLKLLPSPLETLMLNDMQPLVQVIVISAAVVTALAIFQSHPVAGIALAL